MTPERAIEIIIKEKASSEFSYKNKDERRLLIQIIYHVIAEPVIHGLYKYGRRLKEFEVEATKAEIIKIDFLYSFYRKLYQKEIERLYHAFLIKHDLFPLRSGIGNDISDTDIDELEKILNISAALSDENPRLQITDGK